MLRAQASPPNVRGFGKVNVRLNSTTVDIFKAVSAFWWHFSGISMVGGRVQLLIGNNNNDQGQMFVSDCAFQESAGAAVHMLPPAGPLSGFANSTHPNGLPVFPAPPGQTKWRGGFSTQLTLRDSKFIECNQVLVNWGDWTSVQDIWVTTSPTMTPNTAVFENWDRLFVKRVLAVAGTTYGPGRNVSWFHNHAYRLSGGMLHMKEFRFSDDGGCSLFNIVNFAPFLCVPVHNPYDSNVLCATPEPGALSANITWGQSSIVVEGGYLCGVPTAIVLEQIPNQLVLRDTLNLPGSVGRTIVSMGEGLQDLSSTGPNGAAMTLAATNPHALKFVFSDIYNSVSSTASMPVELWPYATQHKIFAAAPPAAGIWKRGQIVWQQIHIAERYVRQSHLILLAEIPRSGAQTMFCVSCWLTTDVTQENGSLATATFPKYDPFQLWREQEQGTPLGWVCSHGGEPGVWVNISSGSIGTDGTLVMAEAGRQSASANPKPEPREDLENEGLRAELASLRATVAALMRRVAALEK
jgi:hypothetical protein